MAPSLSGIGPRQRTPRLRHQATAARDVRTDRRQRLSPGDGAHGREHRSTGRRRCELCAQQLRNSATWVSAPDVARVRAGAATRKTQWTLGELEASLPRPLIPDSTWKVTASHNSSAAPGALDYTRWTSDVPQQPGMWLQVALPQSIMLARDSVRFAADCRREGWGLDGHVSPRLSSRGIDRRCDLACGCRGSGQRAYHIDCVRAGERQFRSHYPDRTHLERACLVHRAAAPLRSTTQPVMARNSLEQSRPQSSRLSAGLGWEDAACITFQPWP